MSIPKLGIIRYYSSSKQASSFETLGFSMIFLTLTWEFWSVDESRWVLNSFYEINEFY